MHKEKFTYSIQGWKDKSTWASFDKEGYKTEIGARQAFKHYAKTGKYKMLMLRKHDWIDGHEYGSEPYLKYENGAIYKNINLKNKREEVVAYV